MKPHSDVLDRIVYDLASSIDTPRSLAVWLCYKHNHAELLKLSATDPAGNDTLQFKLDYQITEYLKKYKGLSTGLDLRAVALEKWLASEQQCRITNKELKQRLRGITPRASAILFMAQRKIAAVLGSFDLYMLSIDSKWANGATYDILKQDAAPDNKMIRPISVTERCQKHLRRCIDNDPHWFYALTGVLPDGGYCTLPALYNVVRGSRFLTVPKSAKTDRCIAAEPTGNSFLQQGLHGYMSKRLKRFGVDLGNQTRNQLLAQRAYEEGYATLDLSAASDSISRELVYELLPVDWAFYMDDLRSHETRVDKTWVRTEKFVSMGNAFCFELETLIFWAIATSASPEDSTVEVYGDDIIVPRCAAADVIDVLSICGFTVNEDKSFVTGNFFESCGEHYHMGQQVTPQYQKEVLNHPSELIRAHNRLKRLEVSLPERHAVRRRLNRLCDWLASRYPAKPIPRIPQGTEGDSGFLSRPALLLKQYDRNRGFRCHVLVWSTRDACVNSESAFYAYRLRNQWYRNCDTFDESPAQRHKRLIRELVHGSGAANTTATGHCAYEVKGRWVAKTQWIPESDTIYDYL